MCCYLNVQFQGQGVNISHIEVNLYKLLKTICVLSNAV